MYEYYIQSIFIACMLFVIYSLIIHKHKHNTHIPTYLHTHAHTHIHTYIHICTHTTYIHTYTHTHIQTYTYIHTCTCVCVCKNHIREDDTGISKTVCIHVYVDLA